MRLYLLHRRGNKLAHLCVSAVCVFYCAEKHVEGIRVFEEDCQVGRKFEGKLGAKVGALYHFQFSSLLVRLLRALFLRRQVAELCLVQVVQERCLEEERLFLRRELFHFCECEGNYCHSERMLCNRFLWRAPQDPAFPGEMLERECVKEKMISALVGWHGGLLEKQLNKQSSVLRALLSPMQP